MKKPENIKQKYVWAAEYRDGGTLTEFESNGLENSFYDIDKGRLKNFWLLGEGDQIKVDCRKGVLEVLGDEYEVLYVLDHVVIPLNRFAGNAGVEDIITYKKAYSDADLLGGGKFINTIVGFYIGYKSKIEIEGMEFNFKVIANKPIGGKHNISVSLVSDKEYNGKIVLLKNGKVIEERDAPLKEGVVGKIRWEVRK